MSSPSRAVAAACVLLAVATGLGAAPGPAGEIVSISGAVEVVRASTQGSLSEGAQVFEGDALVTGADGRVEVRFTDQGRISLAPRSRLVIESYHYREGPPPLGPVTVRAPPSSAVLKFVRGGFRALTGLIGKLNPAAYKVEAPDATIGVRGTEFSGQLCEQACDGNPAGLYVTVHEGAIELGNGAGSIELEAGDFGFVDDRGQAPREIPAEGIDELFKAQGLSAAIAPHRDGPADAASNEVAEADAEDRELEDEEEDWEEEDGGRHCLLPRLGLPGIRP